MELMVSSMLSQLDYQNRQNSQRDKYKDRTHRSSFSTFADPGIVIYNPVEYTCGKVFEEKIGWLRFASSTSNYVYTSTYGCETVFCTDDGCNQRASGFTGYSWFHTYIYSPIAYGMLGLLLLGMLALLGVLVAMLCGASCAASCGEGSRYKELPNQASPRG